MPFYISNFDKSQKKLMATRNRLRISMSTNADKMRNRLRHKKKQVIEYKVDDFVSLFVPKIDRSGTDSIRLPAKIIEIHVLPNQTEKYKLLSAYVF